MESPQNTCNNQETNANPAWLVERLCVLENIQGIDGIAVDNYGNCYLTAFQNGLWRLNKRDTTAECLIKDTSLTLSGIVWRDENLYICDQNNHRILQYSVESGKIRTAVGKKEQGHVDGTFDEATFTCPAGIAVDENGNLYVAECDRIRQVLLRERSVRTAAGIGGSKSNPGFKNGKTTDAQFDRPVGIVIDDDGALYVADRNNFCVRQIKDGEVSTFVGRKEGLLQAEFSKTLYGLAFTDDGSLLVSDVNRLLKVDVTVSTPQDLQHLFWPGPLTRDMEGVIYCGVAMPPSGAPGAGAELWKLTRVGSDAHVLRSCLQTEITWKHIRLFVVGDSGAGKTSLVRWLKGEKFNNEHISTDSVDVSTISTSNSWQTDNFDMRDYMAGAMKKKVTPKKKKQEKPAESTPSPNDAPENFLAAPPLSESQLGKRKYTPSAVSDNNNDNNNSSPDLPPHPKKKVKFTELITPDVIERTKNMKKLSMSFYVWDFAGQEEYYTTHHFFLTQSAIYLLVLDLSKPVDELIPRITFWLDSITYYAPDSPIIVVGTHKDCLKTQGWESITTMFFNHVTPSQNNLANEILEALIRQVRHKKYTIIDQITVSTCMESPEKLRQIITDASSFLVPQKCKLSWMLLYQQLAGFSNSALAKATLSEAYGMAARFELAEAETVDALKFFHRLGLILYHDNKELRNTIFIKPQQLIDVFRTVITNVGLKSKVTKREWKNIQQEGRLKSQILKQKLWNHYPAHIQTHLKRLLFQFELVFRDPAQTGVPFEDIDLLVPSLMTSSSEQTSFKEVQTQVKCCLTTPQPIGFSNRLTSKVVALVTDIKQCSLFPKGCKIRLSNLDFSVCVPSFKQIIIEGPHKTAPGVTLKNLQELLSLIANECSELEITAKCFCCCETELVVDIQADQIRSQTLEKEYLQFVCQNCRYLQPQTPGSTIKLSDVLCEAQRYKELSDVLDVGSFWCKLALELGLEASKIDHMQRAFSHNAEYSPTHHMLLEWVHKSEDTISNFLEILEKVGNSSAKNLVRKWANL
mmetsp:Transcript_20768/g.29162  ORF Transcript_20768/g.29162 Transcript_20768/m.29162 type:complete len:1031 (+) Transcript_20768:58-3150(+)|eukprot:CAMPEP_0168541828 /NCGR_PEP_ID=MMETSP0413-20121227/1023_1 /TAXON_ID=136452 /ORGANISM="Filamoeba nolandi, Strain NC-AS-23-1" /LENGTH=1030 /DNA_ID=CAMNT_0008571665 /DNA_START=30 /DNA_END=3122 /DNA_ORIENTATION=+